MPDNTYFSHGVSPKNKELETGENSSGVGGVFMSGT